MINYLEIETKYAADKIKVKDFRAHANSLLPDRSEDTGSFDHYYTRRNYALRFRDGSTPELTVKKKSKRTNNFVRVEVDVRLSPDTTVEDIEEFARLQKYKHNFTIYKICSIYHWAKHNVVYYVVYDAELKEQARFMEIELNKSVSWESQEEAWDYLKNIEKQYKPLGIAPSKRLHKSLLEMFKR